MEVVGKREVLEKSFGICIVLVLVLACSSFVIGLHAGVGPFAVILDGIGAVCW